MTPKDLFNIILKVFGLFFLKELIITTFQFITQLYGLFKYDSESSIITLVIYLAVISIYVLFVIQLLFKTNKIVDLLKLDQGFDEETFSFDQQKTFSVNFSNTMVLTIALVTLGGYILVDEIPNFCRQFYLYFSQKRNVYTNNNLDFSFVIFSLAKIIIGFLILGERKRIIDFIERKNIDEKSEPE